MKFVVLTIFPEMFDAFWGHGIIRRAIEQKKISASAVNIRDYATNRHRVTDDRPYGGGSGMVMKPEPLAAAIRTAAAELPSAARILLTPQGRRFDQDMARQLAGLEGLILVCGRYEGVDERIRQELIDYEVSIGDYVLSGGELAAMVIVEAVTRLLPGALGGEDAAQNDSFSDGLLEHAHDTRPRIFEGREVPQVLLSGNHREIDRWRRESALVRTLLKRPELLMETKLGRQQLEMLEGWLRRIEKILRYQRRASGAGEEQQ